MLRLKVIYKDGRYEIIDRPAARPFVDLADEYGAETVEIIHYYP